MLDSPSPEERANRLIAQIRKTLAARGDDVDGTTLPYLEARIRAEYGVGSRQAVVTTLETHTASTENDYHLVLFNKALIQAAVDAGEIEQAKAHLSTAEAHLATLVPTVLLAQMQAMADVILEGGVVSAELFLDKQKVELKRMRNWLNEQ